MPKTTQLDIARADKRNEAVEALKARGPAANENSVPQLSERVGLIERILGIEAEQEEAWKYSGREKI